MEEVVKAGYLMRIQQECDLRYVHPWGKLHSIDADHTLSVIVMGLLLASFRTSHVSMRSS